jgi:hypothetical protein
MLPAILVLIFATTFLIASVAVTAGSFLLGGEASGGRRGSLARERTAAAPAGHPEHDLGLAAASGGGMISLKF